MLMKESTNDEEKKERLSNASSSEKTMKENQKNANSITGNIYIGTYMLMKKSENNEGGGGGGSSSDKAMKEKPKDRKPQPLYLYLSRG